MFEGMTVFLMFGLAGAVMVTCALARSSWRRTRAAVCVLIGAAVVVYAHWRLSGLGTVQPEGPAEAIAIFGFAAIELACLFDLLVFLLMMSRTTDRRPEADRHERRLRALPACELPDVDVWIATMNEEWAIIEKTIIGAQGIDWPVDRLRIWVLDDGRRDWLKMRCRELGVRYVARADNRDRKAGNHNNALAVTRAPFILSLDADFVPFPNILWRTLGFFEDARVGIVQTPQSFYNVDPMRQNLRLHSTLPCELAMFYRVQQPARDAWDAAFYVGSCAVLRRAALEDAGGFETTTDIEDQATAIRLLVRGWVTRYLAETLSVGLAPESPAALHDQRNRWCRGSIQILFLRYGPFGRGLPLLHRLFFLQTHWYLGSLSAVIFAAAPALVWLFGWRMMPGYADWSLLGMPILLFASVGIGLSWLSDRLWAPFIWHGLHLYTAVEMVPTALATLVKPFGRPLVHILPVTLKGSVARARRGDRPTFVVLMMLFVLVGGGMMSAAAFDRTVLPRPEGVAALAFWTAYSLGVITIALFCCFSPAHVRAEERFRVRSGAFLDCGDGERPVDVVDLSLGGARLDVGCAAPGHTPSLILRIPGVGTVPCIGVWRNRTMLGVRFVNLGTAERKALIRFLYTVPERRCEAGEIQTGAVARGLMRRFLSPT